MRRWLALGLAVLSLAGCKDTDGDGVRDSQDCEPQKADFFPGNKEICNGIDDNCNGQVDEDVAFVAYWDQDRDGFGNAANARRVCTLPEDGSTEAGDCDDHDALVHPDAVEQCDGIDNDCNNEIDDDVVPLTYYADNDGDGLGDPGVTIEDCIAPPGFVANADDCDDNNPGVADIPELCDGIDNDCDGSIDEDLELVQVFADTDGDGSGDPATPGLECGALPGWSLDDRDCDDSDPLLGGSSEDIQGNGIDEDCDGYIDEYGVPVPYATYEDAITAMPDTVGMVVQFDDGWHQVNVNLSDEDLTIAGEGCGRTILYAASPEPVISTASGAVEGLTLSGGTAQRGGGLRVKNNGSVVATGICVEGNAADDGGGVAVMESATLELLDSRVASNVANSMGGGVYVSAYGSLDMRRTEVAANDALIDFGGGVAVRGGHAEIHNSIMAGNFANTFGGGLYVANEAVVPGATYTGTGTGTGTGGTGDPITARGSANVSFSTFHANRLGVGNINADPLGAGLMVGGASVDIGHSTFSGHLDEVEVILTRTSNVANENVSPFLTTRDLAFRGNTGMDYNGTNLLGSHRSEPGFADVRATVDPGDWDLRYTVLSDWLDGAIAVGLDKTDPDGTPADLGAWGGPKAVSPNAGAPLWRPRPGPDSARTVDSDGDGLMDAWEERWGTVSFIDDGNDDPDADGTDNLAEQAAFTDPHSADTDLDGVDDTTELATGAAPTDPSDFRPIAFAGGPRFARVGDPISVDGTASIDPNGDVLSYDWVLTGTPFGSGATVADPAAPQGTFTPDFVGEYILQLTVSDGAGEHTTDVMIDARTGPIVPDDQPTLQAAVSATYDGQGIFIRAGVYAPVDLSGRDLALIGLDPRDQVVIDGGGVASAVTAIIGGAQLSSLTVANGDAERGAGIHAETLDQLLLYDVVLRDNVGGRGGAVYALDSPVVASDVVLRDNAAGQGGAVYIAGAKSEWQRVHAFRNGASEGGAFYFADKKHFIDASTFQDNSATDGAVVWNGATAKVNLHNTSAAGNQGESSWYNAGGSAWAYGALWLEDDLRSGATILVGFNPAVWRMHFNWIGGANPYWYDENIGAATLETQYEGDPLVVSWIDNGDETDDLLAPRLGSPMVNAGWPDFEDRNGTRADVGGYAGPNSLVAGLAGQHDSDGDGLADAWETLFGLDPSDAGDAALDPDGDGWANDVEYTNGTNPNATDSDGDGVDDPDEVLAGTDPTGSSDQRPVAVVALSPSGRVGQEASADGSGSYDPDGVPGPLTHQWRLIRAPSGSLLADGDLLDAQQPVVRFTPDVSGDYLLGLIVNDGALDSVEGIGSVHVVRYLDVPSQYATIEDAYLDANPFDIVRLEPGIHDLNLTEWMDDVAIEGFGVDQTFVHGFDGYSAFELVSGDSGVLRDMTIAGASGNWGGGIRCHSSSLVGERLRFEFNTSWEGGAIRAWVCDVELTDVDVFDSDVSSRGGAYAGIEGSLTWTRGEIARNSADGTGAGIWLDNTDATLKNLVIHHNETESSGGAIFQQTRNVNDDVPIKTTIEHCTVAGNSGLSGALYLAFADVRYSVVQENMGYGVYQSNLGEIVDVDWMGHANNELGLSNANPTIGTNTVNADAMFWNFDQFDTAWTSDLRLQWWSPMRDAGELNNDPDGTLADLGAYGGPDAPLGWNDYFIDTDGDGMMDAWELANGTDPNVADGGADPDLDGRSNIGEHDFGTDPFVADTDGDGVSDGVEGDPAIPPGNPTDPSDYGPVADPGAAPPVGPTGVQVNLDGSSSYDPDAEPITAYQWTFLSKPGRSVLDDSDLTPTSSVQFTPDFPGTYDVGLVVSAGGGVSPMSSVAVVVEGTVLVPEDYGTVDAAADAVADGFTVDIGAGVWPTHMVIEDKDVILIGAGVGDTILDGEQTGSVLRGDGTETLTVSDMTITGGLAAEGGGIKKDDGDLVVTDVTLSNNTAQYGGGIYVKRGTVTLTRVRLVDNTVGRTGGGLYTTGSSIDMLHTLVAGNLAVSQHGGGLNMFDGDVLMFNSIFSNNTTLEHGGALYLNGVVDANQDPTSSILIENTALTHNSGRVASAIKIVRADVTIRNSIIAHNRDDVAVIVDGLTNDYDQWYCLMEDNDSAHFDLSQNPLLFIPGDNDIRGNVIDQPAELTGLSEDGDWSNDDWALGVGSAAIDAGDPAVLDPDASVSDIGAFGGPDAIWTP